MTPGDSTYPTGNTGDIVDLTVETVVYPGKGLAHLDGMVVFVPGVIKGEQVRARITKRTKTFAEALPRQLLKASPSRVDCGCPLALRPGTDGTFGPERYCPGCCYRQMPYDEEIVTKQEHLLSFLSRQARIDTSACMPPVPSPVRNGYRNKLVLHALPDDPSHAIGYFGPDNTSIIDVPSCPLGAESLNSHLVGLRTTGHLLDGLSHPLTLTLRALPDGGAVHWCGKTPPEQLIRENTALGAVQVPLGSFFQVNPMVAAELLREFVKGLASYRVERGIDLYGGIGLFGFAAAQSGIPDIHIIDSDPAAISTVQANARSLSLEGITSDAGTAERRLNAILSRSTTRSTLLIVDPPRAGLARRVVDTILKHKPDVIACVSCAPDTLARDLALLAKGGYMVKSVRMFDMFPCTPYFETLTWLQWSNR